MKYQCQAKTLKKLQCKNHFYKIKKNVVSLENFTSYYYCHQHKNNCNNLYNLNQYKIICFILIINLIIQYF